MKSRISRRFPVSSPSGTAYLQAVSGVSGGRTCVQAVTVPSPNRAGKHLFEIPLDDERPFVVGWVPDEQAFPLGSAQSNESEPNPNQSQRPERSLLWPPSPTPRP